MGDGFLLPVPSTGLGQASAVLCGCAMIAADVTELTVAVVTIALMPGLAVPHEEVVETVMEIVRKREHLVVAIELLWPPEVVVISLSFGRLALPPSHSNHSPQSRNPQFTRQFLSAL